MTDIIHSFCMIWYCRNQLRFQNVTIPLGRALSLIMASTNLSGKMSTRVNSSSIMEFTILKAFSIEGHPRMAPSIKLVEWIVL